MRLEGRGGVRGGGSEGKGGTYFIEFCLMLTPCKQLMCGTVLLLRRRWSRPRREGGGREGGKEGGR